MVLDGGCGRGLMLLGAAKRLTTGKAMGVDVNHGEGTQPTAAILKPRPQTSQRARFRVVGQNAFLSATAA